VKIKLKTLLIFMVFSTVLFANTINLAEDEQNWLNNHKVIRMCNNPNWKPIEFAQDGNNLKIDGIAIDTLRLIEKKLDIKFKTIPTSSWSQSQQFLKEKRCDILPAAIKTKQREKYAYFTEPYLNFKLAIITQNNKPFIDSLENILDKTIARKKGSGLIAKLKSKYPNIKIIETKDYLEALKKVSSGEAYYTIATLPVASYYITQFALNNLHIAGYTDMIYKLSIAVSNDKPILTSILDKALHSISKIEHKNINNRWIDSNIKQTVDYDFIFKILFVVFIVIILFIYRQYILNKKNKDLKKLQKIIEKKSQQLQKNMDIMSKHIIYSRTNTKGIITEVSDAFCEISQYSKKELIGKSHNIVRDASTPKELFADMWNTIKQGKVWQGELRNIKKDGSYYWVLANIEPEFDNDKIIGYMAIRHDITAKKDFEKQHLKLLEAEKLASMGEMIGNIAHQWRQPLSVISTSASGIHLKKEYGILSDQELFKLCEIIDENAQYLSKTIDDFKNYVKGDSKQVSFKLRNKTDSFLKIVESSIKTYKIQVILDLVENDEIKGYPNELLQCFINIFNNAKDALVENNDEDNRYIFISQKIDNNKIIIEFKDNAGGIPENVLPKIFEPYFTTKHKSQGTGLGLHMVYNIITEGMKGDIKVENKIYTFNDKEYKGASFKLILPFL